MSPQENKGHFLFIRQLLQRMGILLLAYFLVRLAFWLLNYSDIAKAPASELPVAFLTGIRYDLIAIIYSNALIILLHLLPFDFRYAPGYQRLLKILFYVFNGLMLAIAVGDLGFYPFNHKRINADLLSMAGSFGLRIGQFFVDYWFYFLLFALMIVLIEWLYRKTTIRSRGTSPWYVQLALVVPVLALAFLGARGGWQVRPLTPVQASRVVSPAVSPLVTNSPYTFLYSLQKRKLQPVHFMSDEAAADIVPVWQRFNDPAAFRRKNVVFLILESFGSEYVGSLNDGKGYTPFFDSLAAHGLLYTNAFANAERSNKALAAILSGLPSLMDEPIMTSLYADNCLPGIASALKNEGYTTAFFHGGINGEFNFDAFTRAVGFDAYYGRNEFGDDRFFDGHWGIYDEEFMQYFAKKQNELKEPFCAALFSLTSHDPFPVPKRYSGRWPKGDNEIIESIGYTDYSLQQYFEAAKKQSWFANTLFIIVADHTFQFGYRQFPRYNSHAGRFAVPLLFYAPGDSLLAGRDSRAVQQTDIYPTVLDYLHYKGEFAAFGKSALSAGNHVALALLDNVYQAADTEYCLLHDGSRVLGLYNYRSDFAFNVDLSAQQPDRTAVLQQELEATLQRFRSALVKNDLCR